MGRDLTPFILQSLTRSAFDKALTLKTHLAADIVLNDAERTILRYATGAIIVSSLNIMGQSFALDSTDSGGGGGSGGVSIGGESPYGPSRVYEARLRKTPDVKFSLGQAPDNASITVENLSGAFGSFVADFNTFFDGSSVVLYECFMMADATYEADTVFVGKVDDTLEASDEEATLMLVSDMSAKDALVAARQLTQRCLATFEDDRCRHTGALAGATCSKIKEDATNGCRFWGWEHSFFGANFSELTSTNVATSTQSDPDINRTQRGGFPPDGYPRPGRFFDLDYVTNLVY